MYYYKNIFPKDIEYFCKLDFVYKTEKWNPIKNYEGIYLVSDLGRIKSLKKSKQTILKQSKNTSEYLSVSLTINNKSKTRTVHQLVSISFLNHNPCGYKMVVNHKNHEKLDNRLVNLEITTNRENTNKSHIKTHSNFVGVCWHKKSEKWISRIRIGSIQKHLGLFELEIDASNAYLSKLKEITNM